MRLNTCTILPLPLTRFSKDIVRPLVCYFSRLLSRFRNGLSCGRGSGISQCLKRRLLSGRTGPTRTLLPLIGKSASATLNKKIPPSLVVNIQNVLPSVIVEAPDFLPCRRVERVLKVSPQSCGGGFRLFLDGVFLVDGCGTLSDA